MFDTIPPDPVMQRIDGAALVRIGTGGLERLVQRGAAKAMLPRMHGQTPEIVFLNTAGGLTGGDRLSYSLKLGAGARAVATTQTAERAYRSAGGAAEVGVEITAGCGARLHWLPQETILFDGAALHRRTRIALSGDARALMLETLVLGRAAMGETVARLDLSDRREVTRDGRPVLIEPVAITDAELARRSGAAVLRGARALATLALVAPGAEDAETALRGALPAAPDGVEYGLSGWDGRLVLRALAADAAPLRRLLIAAMTQLGDAPPPRVWQI